MASIKYILLVFIVSLTISNSIQCAYSPCPDPYNPNNLLQHTMCRYSETLYGQKCNNRVYSSSLDDTDKIAILNRHNELRAKVAAGQELQGLYGGQPAGVIGPLQWDNELALIAQRWANQCDFSHDACRGLGEMKVGQNVAYQGSNGGFEHDYLESVNNWYNEVKYFDSSHLSNHQPGNGPMTTHYTQLVWAKTTHVGCGAVKYYDNQFYKTHVVCNYSPAGNMIGESVYTLKNQPGDVSNVMVPPRMFAFQPTYESNVETPSIAHEKQPDKTPAPIARSRFRGLSTHKVTRAHRSHKKPTVQRVTPNFNQVPNKRFQYGDAAPVTCHYEKCKDLNGVYEDHTMCKYPNRDMAAKCNQVQKLTITKQDRNDILQIHNSMSREIMLKARNRGQPVHNKEYKWNDELAQIAQRWANQCSYQHDICRNIYGGKVEQNVGQVSSCNNGTIPFSYIVNKWYTILESYGLNQQQPSERHLMLKIFTQLNWFYPTEIGCGGTEYRGTDGLFKTYLVCNYLVIN